MYIKIVSGNIAKYPYSPTDLIRDTPQTSFPAGLLQNQLLAAFGVFPVTTTAQPQADLLTQIVKESTPVFIGDVWEQRWEVVDMFETQAEKDATIAADLKGKRDAAWERIKVHRDYLSENGGYKVSIGGVDKWFHSDAKSKTQQLSLMLLGANASAVPPWKTMDGSKVVMSQALAGQIFAAAVTQDGALFAAAEVHRVAMETSNTPESYDFSDSWPTVFVE